VFTNLILNALDAMPDGGDLWLRCLARGERVRAEVEDTGIGMTEEVRRHLFDPFFTTKGPSGTGLGMSVAYGIVTRHDGVIEVSSRVGRGTQFVLEFPVCREAVVPRGGEVTEVPHDVRAGRILVIDDEPPIAELLHDALAGEGHAVMTALSGTSGVELARSNPFDLVLTDLGMPDMSGWEVASRIRSAHPGVPVVLVTGWGTTISHDEVERRGITAVVHKPFEIKELLDTTQRVLRDASEADPARPRSL
jgi:CheY-like chemotaxis protein